MLLLFHGTFEQQVAFAYVTAVLTWAISWLLRTLSSRALSLAVGLCFAVCLLDPWGQFQRAFPGGDASRHATHRLLVFAPLLAAFWSYPTLCKVLLLPVVGIPLWMGVKIGCKLVKYVVLQLWACLRPILWPIWDVLVRPHPFRCGLLVALITFVEFYEFFLDEATWLGLRLLVHPAWVCIGPGIALLVVLEALRRSATLRNWLHAMPPLLMNGAVGAVHIAREPINFFFDIFRTLLRLAQNGNVASYIRGMALPLVLVATWAAALFFSTLAVPFIINIFLPEVSRIVQGICGAYAHLFVGGWVCLLFAAALI